MKFDAFIEFLPKIEKEKLLATDAHIKMAPLERISYLKDIFISILKSIL